MSDGSTISGGSAPDAILARCPRCGYDVSGPIETWTDRCPIEGRCTECGLTFEWGDLLNPTRFIPPWLFEQANEHKVRALWKTLHVATKPHHILRVVRLEHDVRPIRLAVLVLITLLMAHFGLALGVYLYSVSEAPMRMSLGSREWMTGVVLSLACPYSDEVRYVLAPNTFGWVESFFDPWFWTPLFAFLLSPLAMIPLGDTMKRARVRKQHLVRLVAIGLPSLAAWMLLLVACRVGYSVATEWLGVMITQRLLNLIPYLGVLGWLAYEEIFFVAGFLWLPLFWHAAAKHYFRFEQYRAITLIVCVISILAVLALDHLLSSWSILDDVLHVAWRLID